MKVDYPALLKAFEDPTPENQYMVDLQNGSLVKLNLEDAPGAVGNCSPVGVLSAGGCPGLDVRRGES